MGSGRYGDFHYNSGERRAPRIPRTPKPKQSKGTHKGGFSEALHGSIDGIPVTVAFGWGTKEGHTLLADGHVDLATFKQHGNHNHYGPGNGPHGNVKDRFQYSGPDH